MLIGFFYCDDILDCIWIFWALPQGSGFSLQVLTLSDNYRSSLWDFHCNP